MHQIAAPVLLVLAGLWLAYLVPYKLRHRQQLLESRADDRYSEALRVVAVTTRAPRSDGGARSGRVVRTVETRAHAGTTGLLTPGRGLVAVAAGRTGGDTVDRPHATGEHVTAEAARRAATLRASRAALGARRAAAARRRAGLAVVLLVATAAGWLALGLVPDASVVLGVAPTALLALVLVTGRRAVVAGKRNDEAMARQILESEEIVANPRSGATRAVSAPTAAVAAAAPAAGKRAPATAGTTSAASHPLRSVPTPKVTGRAVHPSEAQTEVFAAIVADHGEKGATARHATGQIPVVASRVTEPSSQAATAAAAAAASAQASAATAMEADERWAPVPVPRPTYAMKPAAPHREPVPLGEVEGSTAVRPASATDDELRTPELPAEVSASIDLNAVLAKRRAAGE